MTDTDNATPRPVGQYLGQVKWFNNRRGYGFLKIVSGDRTDEDIFVHQSYVMPLTSEYRALYEGEYVSFNVKEATENERSQAIDVTGVNGGPLMCDKPRNSGFTRVGGGRGRGRGGRGRGARSATQES
jgi:cold shock CspA family protein